MAISCSLPYIAAAVLVQPSAPQTPPAAPPDKDGYGLGNLTPRPQMRDLSADRPDVTESPYTVDAGHLQLELSVLEWTGNDDDGPRMDAWEVAPLNIKLGLTNSAELQLLVSPWSIIEERDGPRSDGPGDAAIRFKYNLWGNDIGATALAIMPFVTIPSGADGVSADRVEGGLIVPFAIELPAGFSLGLMAELDLGWNADDDAYDLDFVHSAALGRDIVGDLGGFVEYVGAASSSSGTNYRATINLGLTLGLGPDLQLDGGIGFGITDDADDTRVFTGLTVRF